MKRLLVVAVLPLFVLGVAPTARATGVRVPVDIVGDSIMYYAEPATYAELTTGIHQYDPTISARPGTTMAQNLPVIEQMQQTASQDAPQGALRPDWVVELGTNDALRSNPSWWWDFMANLSALHGACVVFVTVGTQLPFGSNAIAGDIDLSIYYQTLENQNIHEVDWGDAEYTNANWLLPDHVHPSPAGSRQLADMIHHALNTAC